MPSNEERPVEISLYYITSRYYNPEIGRFISPDSVDYLDPTSINGLNLYAYCNNDPVNYCDPSGHMAVSAIVALIVFGAISVLTAVGEIVAACRVEDVYEHYKDQIEIVEGRVCDSNKVSNIFDIWALSMYVRYHSDKNVARGSAFGIFIEWTYHNIGAFFGFENGIDLDYSFTIFNDFQNHHSWPSVLAPIVMSVTELILNPFFFAYDVERLFV